MRRPLQEKTQPWTAYCQTYASVNELKYLVVPSLVHKTQACDKQYNSKRLRKEGNVLFNDALNTFYLQLYGVKQIAREETRCRHIGYSFRLAAWVLLYASSHRQDNTYHSICYTSRGALAGTRNSSMGPPHEGLIRRSIAPWANALTTELHLTPKHLRVIKSIKACKNIPSEMFSDINIWFVFFPKIFD